MAISIDQLPYDADGSLTGLWMFQLRQNLHGNHGGAFFQDGRTVTPIDSLSFKRFVASMGADIVGAIRVAVGDPTEIGDVRTLKPLSYDDAHSKTLEAQDSNKLRRERELEATLKQVQGAPDVAQHALAGAKFVPVEEQKNRQAFEEADPKSQEVAQRGGEPTAGAPNADASTDVEPPPSEDEDDESEDEDEDEDGALLPPPAKADTPAATDPLLDTNVDPVTGGPSRA